MDRILSVVRDVFEITGRGCVVVPGIPEDVPHNVKVGDPVRLIRPDETTIETRIAGIELFSSGGPIPILLAPEIKKADVPIGTQVVLA